MKTLRVKIDDVLAERLARAAKTIGYSSEEELVQHIISRELDRLCPEEGESEEEIRRKLEGLGYMA